MSDTNDSDRAEEPGETGSSGGTGATGEVGREAASVEEAGLFDVDSSVTLYEELPEEDVPPDYPPPELD